MKQLLTTLIILISITSTAQARRIISHNCHHSYVEGKKIMNMNTGVILRVCWNKKSLPKSYVTDFYSDCASTHRATKKVVRGEHFDTKMCIKKGL